MVVLIRRFCAIFEQGRGRSLHIGSSWSASAVATHVTMRAEGPERLGDAPRCVVFDLSSVEPCCDIHPTAALCVES